MNHLIQNDAAALSAGDNDRGGADGAANDCLLDVQNLSVSFGPPHSRVHVVKDVSLQLRRAETLALVGESGSGKSVTSLALMGLMPVGVQVELRGQVRLRRRDGRWDDMLRLSGDAMREIRGREIGMIFQEPMTSLNPVHTIGAQIAEAVAAHERLGRGQAMQRAIELLEHVGISEPKRRAKEYPNHLSGGMRQRVMIAIALASAPRVLIADEPTTALDVTVQAQILELLKRLQKESGMAVLFITHNLGVVAQLADRVAVMYAGRIIEQADVIPMFEQPLMPYTRGLLKSVPRMDMAARGDLRLEAIEGTVPDPRHPATGCDFAARCAHAVPSQCNARVPDLEPARSTRLVRCTRWKEIVPC